jgi:hypothetical protein
MQSWNLTLAIPHICSWPLVGRSTVAISSTENATPLSLQLQTQQLQMGKGPTAPVFLGLMKWDKIFINRNFSPRHSMRTKEFVVHLPRTHTGHMWEKEQVQGNILQRQWKATEIITSFICPCAFISALCLKTEYHLTEIKL